MNFKVASVGSRRVEEVEPGEETISGTKPSRNAARRLLTEATAPAFSIGIRDERAETDAAGPERH
jgi:hypothetical protein